MTELLSSVKYKVNDYQGVADDVLTRTGIVLLVWEHHAIQHIAETLGVSDAPAWKDNDFDSIWKIQFIGGKAVLTFGREGISK